MNKNYLILLPLVFVGIISLLFVWNLNFEKKEPLIVSDIPYFNMTDLNGKKIDQSIFKEDEYKLINVWATWCINCKLEHGFLMSLKNQNFNWVNINRPSDLVFAKKGFNI